jgi:hypothetical protein
MPTRRHLRNRQALQVVRFFLLMTHWPPFLQSPMADTLLYVRPKNDWKKKIKFENKSIVLIDEFYGDKENSGR